jgi:hypothetical protein
LPLQIQLLDIENTKKIRKSTPPTLLSCEQLQAEKEMQALDAKLRTSLQTREQDKDRTENKARS